MSRRDDVNDVMWPLERVAGSTKDRQRAYQYILQLEYAGTSQDRPLRAQQAEQRMFFGP